MRKLLLATVAVLGGSIGAASLAQAQTATTAAPVTPPTVVPTPVPFTLTPSQTPGPGTITVRLNARFNAYAAAVSDSGRNPGTVTPVASSATSNGSPQTNTKLSDFATFEYARLYPGFDGIAGNGLKYGASIEIRQDSGVAPGGGSNGSVSRDRNTSGQLYYNVAGAYIGTDQFGFLRYGDTYGPSTLFMTGTFENFNDGAWNGDLPDGFSGNLQLAWPFADVGFFYARQKAVYLSPQFYGFDFAVSFAPTDVINSDTGGNCPYGVTATSTAGLYGNVTGGAAALGCNAAASTTSGDYTRDRDMVEAYARYRGAFGPIGVAAEVGYIGSGKVNDSTYVAPGATPRQQYQGFSLGDSGFQVTYGGLAVGGHIEGGAGNGQGLAPKGGQDEFQWLGGASYAFGPVIVGASYFDWHYAGSKTSVTSPFVGNRNEYGIAAGGTYTFAPGMNIFLSYLYGHEHQNGIDLLSGAGVQPGTTAATTTKVVTHNAVQAQGISIGTQFRW